MKWIKAQSTASWPAIGGANRSHVPVILGPILEQQRQTATGPEAEQVAVLADYALGIQTAINLEVKQPSKYAGIAVYDGLTALHRSLEQIEKKWQQ